MSGQKVWVVASTEFGTVVRTKGFIIGLLLMPILVGVSIGVQVLMKRTDTRPRNFAVVDRSGWLYEPIEAAAKGRNEAMTKAGKAQPAFVPSAVPAIRMLPRLGARNARHRRMTKARKTK